MHPDPGGAAPVAVSRLRVAVVQPGGVLGGAERWQLRIGDATDRLDIRAFALGDGPTVDQWRARGWSVTRLSGTHSLPGLLRVASAIVRSVRRDPPDVLVAHGVKGGLTALPAAQLLGVPLVWVRHDGSFAARLVPLLDRLSSGQISTSDWLTRLDLPDPDTPVTAVKQPIGNAASRPWRLFRVTPASRSQSRGSRGVRAGGGPAANRCRRVSDSATALSPSGGPL